MNVGQPAQKLYPDQEHEQPYCQHHDPVGVLTAEQNAAETDVKEVEQEKRCFNAADKVQ